MSIGTENAENAEEFGTHWITVRDPEGNECDIGAGLAQPVPG